MSCLREGDVADNTICKRNKNTTHNTNGGVGGRINWWRKLTWIRAGLSDRRKISAAELLRHGFRELGTKKTSSRQCEKMDLCRSFSFLRLKFTICRDFSATLTVTDSRKYNQKSQASLFAHFQEEPPCQNFGFQLSKSMVYKWFPGSLKNCSIPFSSTLAGVSHHSLVGSQKQKKVAWASSWCRCDHVKTFSARITRRADRYMPWIHTILPWFSYLSKVFSMK